METINQINNFQNSKNDIAQNCGGANIGYQINNYFNAHNIYSINQNKYLEHFIDKSSSLISMKIEKKYVIDFYFYFLSNFRKENNFGKSLNEYINFQKGELKRKDYLEKKILEIKEYERKRHYKLKFELEESLNNFYFDDNNIRKKLYNELDSNLEKKSDIINGTLSFIETWDFEILVFINHLIKTDFELFINSASNELLFHALGFLFYTNNNINIDYNIYLYGDEIEVFYDYNVKTVRDIFDFIIENREKRNIDFVKYITSNPKNFYQYKQYFKINKFLISMKEIENKIIFDEKIISEIISNPIKLKEINILADEYERKKNQEAIIDQEILLNYLEELPIIKSVMSLINK